MEGEIERGLVRLGVASTSASARLRVASRTDRGVSARANAVAMSSELPAAALLRALNGIAPDIFFTAAREVGPTFSPRHAVRRWYRYLEAAPERRAGALERWRQVAACFSGTIDGRSFGRRIASREPVWRTVESFEVSEHRDELVLDLRAPSFLWGMVRKIVTAGRAVVAGELSLDRLRAVIEGRTTRGFPLAEAEPLILWSVEYEEGWTHWAHAPTRAQLRRWRQERGWSRARSTLQELAWEGFLGPAATGERPPSRG